jgi:hypothetical protein
MKKSVTYKGAKIKVGLKFKITKTGRTYEVTRVSNVSVWFKDVTRTPIWREAKTTFLNKFNNGFEII